jgi:4'-phosphopantetheinyl transferase
MSKPASGTVTLHRVSLIASEQLVTTAFSMLSEDERSRAKAYLTTDLQRRFIIGRASLRKFLSSCIDLPPERIQFSYGAFGKPQLSYSEAPVCFNTSHSRDQAVFAFRAGGEVGIDIEVLDQEQNALVVANQFLHREEFEEASAAGPLRARFCLNRWVQKEAVAKAMGEGLSAPLTEIVVRANGERGSYTGQLQRTGQIWKIKSFSELPHYIGAIAYSGDELELVSNPQQSAESVLG